MRIYVLRHGTTVWNEQGRTQGRRQNKLSKSGQELAKQTAEKLKNEKIDIIYSSPLMRTIQTSNIVNKYHNVKINRCDLLTEIDQGIFSGKLYRTLTDEEKQLKSIRHPSTKMEPLDVALKRVKEFIATILKSETHENILIVSHNTICSFFECIFKGIEPDFSNHAQLNAFGNAEFKVFEI